MATTVAQACRRMSQIERELRGELQKDNPLFGDIDHLITELRIASEAALLADFEYATKENIGSRLWDLHGEIKNRYRKLIDHHENRNPVEKRKVLKHYVDFIKMAQFFYKGYIQRLASHFAGMKNLRQIAHRMSLCQLSVDTRVVVSPEVEQLIDLSCYDTLVHLGDLSRYRNVLRSKDRSWEAALAYYALARDFIPDSGTAYNQMAVVAVADDNYLDSLYYLYRAITVKQPTFLGQGNLEHEFKRFLKSSNDILTSAPNDQALFVVHYFILHAEFYKGAVFSKLHEEIENTVLHRLSLLLKEQSFEDLLNKFVLINIAAAWFASEKVTGSDSPSEEMMRSCSYLFRFNVHVLLKLLQVLQAELPELARGDDVPGTIAKIRSLNPQDMITPIVRRILPALRQYTAWLVYNTSIVTKLEQTFEANRAGPMQGYCKEMWSAYFAVISVLCTNFPIKELSAVDYLLREDEMAVGFRPLHYPPLTSDFNLFVKKNGQPKSRVTDPGVQRSHSDTEMLARISEIVTGAIALHKDRDCPLLMSQTGKFEPKESSISCSPSTVPIPDPSLATAVSPSKSGEQKGGSVLGKRSTTRSQQNMDSDMHRMVDDLLKPSSSHNKSQETSYGMHSRTANEIFGSVASGFQAQPIVQSAPRVLASFPGIFNSPFTPHPHELQQTSPNGSANLRQPPMQLSQLQRAAAARLEEVTGYGSQPASWDRRDSRRVSNQGSQSVNQLLQDSLSREYMPASSAFSDSSSIYGNNTPLMRRAGPNPGAYGNNTTDYSGASGFEQAMMLQSSLRNGSQSSSAWPYSQFPPGGQGG